MSKFSREFICANRNSVLVPSFARLYCCNLQICKLHKKFTDPELKIKTALRRAGIETKQFFYFFARDFVAKRH